MIGTDQNDSASVLSQDQSLKSPSGKMGSDLVSEDTMISKDGSVIGTLKYVSQWKEFSNSKEEQSGYYFPVILDEKYKGKEITCTGTKVTKAVDLECSRIIRNQNLHSQPMRMAKFYNYRLMKPHLILQLENWRLQLQWESILAMNAENQKIFVAM